MRETKGSEVMNLTKKAGSSCKEGAEHTGKNHRNCANCLNQVSIDFYSLFEMSV